MELNRFLRYTSINGLNHIFEQVKLLLHAQGLTESDYEDKGYLIDITENFGVNTPTHRAFTVQLMTLSTVASKDVLISK